MLFAGDQFVLLGDNHMDIPPPLTVIDFLPRVTILALFNNNVKRDIAIYTQRFLLIAREISVYS